MRLNPEPQPLGVHPRGSRVMKGVKPLINWPICILQKEGVRNPWTLPLDLPLHYREGACLLMRVNFGATTTGTACIQSIVLFSLDMPELPVHLASSFLSSITQD